MSGKSSETKEAVIVTWEKEPASARLERCRILLDVYGMLSDSDSSRLADKISRRKERLLKLSPADGDQNS